jgi:hypothetical protein
VTESFENEQWAFDKGVIAGKVSIIPDERPLYRGHSDEETDRSKKEKLRPLFAAECNNARADAPANSGISRCLIHEQDCE